jgi:2-keto-4-pentenoate hydratase/2-oxohepta-3-ene-1,7-dioic acid hydratase in catechol pathway
MIFPVAKLISYLSEFMTLEPGDLIATGTPPGFGAAAKPPVFLRDSDQVRLGSAKLGTQQHLVEAWRAA